MLERGTDTRFQSPRYCGSRWKQTASSNSSGFGHYVADCNQGQNQLSAYSQRASRRLLLCHVEKSVASEILAQYGQSRYPTHQKHEFDSPPLSNIPVHGALLRTRNGFAKPYLLAPTRHAFHKSSHECLEATGCTRVRPQAVVPVGTDSPFLRWNAAL